MITPGIGTAQLGLPYGAYAQESLMSETEAHNILQSAINKGISFIDTARAYGKSEERIGSFLQCSAPSTECTLCTKLPRVDEVVWKDSAAFAKAMDNSLKTSVEHLGHPISVLLLHQCEVEFLSYPEVNSYFSGLQLQHPAMKLGISVYSMEEAYAAIQLSWVSFLQCPVSLVDQRFLDPEFLATCAKKQVKIIARSIFLQGILTDNTPIPEVRKKPLLTELRTKLKNVIPEVSLENAAISFIFKNHCDSIAVGIFGIHSTSELDNNMALLASSTALSSERLTALQEAISFAKSHQLYDPRTWKT